MVNLLTLERSFETRAPHLQPDTFDSWSHEQYISYNDNIVKFLIKSCQIRLILCDV